MSWVNVNTNAHSGADGGNVGGFNFSPVKGIDPQKLIYVAAGVVVLFLLLKAKRGRGK